MEICKEMTNCIITRSSFICQILNKVMEAPLKKKQDYQNKICTQDQPLYIFCIISLQLRLYTYTLQSCSLFDECTYDCYEARTYNAGN